MADKLTIHYLQPFRFPSDHAHSIQVINTCHALAELGHTVVLDVKHNRDNYVWTFEEGLAYYGLTPHENLQLRWLPTTHNGITGLSARWRVRRSRGKRLVFYARHFRLARSAAKNRSGPVILEVHKLEPEAQRAAVFCDGVTAITTPLKDACVREWGLRCPTAVIPDAVDRARFPLPTETGPRRLVYTGHMHDWKGVDVLVRSLKSLPEVEALIIGGKQGDDPNRDALQRLAAEEGVADRIEWTGHIPQTEIAGKLRRGDVGVVPTRGANGQDIAASPLKMFEYLSSGLPVVATDMPSIRDIFDKVDGGTLFAEGDPDALAGAVKGLLGDDAYAAASAAADRSADFYTWERRAVLVEVFLNQVLMNQRD
jgi:glycosyltransferase involved in cell wall biosynthesis